MNTVLTLNHISFQQVQQPSPLLHLARELDPSCWMMWPAVALRPDFLTALTQELVLTIVSILKMLVSDVKVSYNCLHELKPEFSAMKCAEDASVNRMSIYCFVGHYFN